MAKVEQFNLQVISLVCIGLLCVGCAHSARDLPPDMSHLPPSMRLLPSDMESAEYQLDCKDLTLALTHTREHLKELEKDVMSMQADNQSKGLTGITVFSPAMFLISDNPALSKDYQESDQARERLLRIAQARQCELPSY
ncbi:hypothetical protein FA592_07385 [Sulfurospirillum diekertiae]|uniref:Uncharacterized protein n=1 Tax=Sulfurospirillum diekertiae TaxID=1854492 RepID=A0A6G9VSW8_9BACT|nr:hypothetical protein [Sulfurospirillum diekertiae]QIR76064.1 hypothetical protein FA584_07530 [Sulfurospirillum diekertiae]QIR78702.1 hypothetical protein FA592_07385 [Sulfurospirillum diekertiae]